MTSRRSRARETPQAPPPPGKRHRRLPGEMTATEAKYAEVLAGRKLLGEILDFEYEPEVLVLSESMDCGYLPDFRVTELDGSASIYEIKHKANRQRWEDGYIKLKWAADKFAPTPFYLAVYHGPKRGWVVRRMGEGGKRKKKAKGPGAGSGPGSGSGAGAGAGSGAGSGAGARTCPDH